MDYKEEFKSFVEEIKSKLRQHNGDKYRNEDIAMRLGYERTYFSSLLGKRGVVQDHHIKTIQKEFADDFKKLMASSDVNINSEPTILNNNTSDNYKDRYIALLEEKLNHQESAISKLQISLEILLRRQQVMAAMNEAMVEPLLVDLAQRKHLKMDEVRRSVRNRAFSRLDVLQTKGTQIETYI